MTSVPDHAPPDYTTEVYVDFCQFYVRARGADIDWLTVDLLNDGLISPSPWGLRVSTGTQGGSLPLTVQVLDAPPGELAPADGEVAAECSITLDEGIVDVVGMAEDVPVSHDFGQQLIVRMRVVASGRDAAMEHGVRPGLTPERVRLYLWPEPEARARTVPAHLDRAGVLLRTWRS